ncbi:bifunctional adenosylcobinamide kinase/adenosylcobinamide-phosphate guanylyltransferase [Anaerosacchariphilus polymeriproducens]|uniref:Adenosylcobinamide kinase n=1 Tax=Anaerosacchariphilus polymeriproducens TaxID=1812858 RepID=A0A371AYI4_9FIRM|nr:bifunctional adenosylcobinamide kinase/adenosylcobinamide-phosphate guanylyltransferase [Anaerosacchariphilus polymeriproducens]RDU24540.1 bifunctional adenosylcobinamide kinase/adenosylcobinamide-phosphate guanylyltransferase [Anaerosacchariphilus polymeriproducens]
MLHIITGGSGSGKSVYAEDKILALSGQASKAKRIYIATMYPVDEESHQRIEKHRRMRENKNFETIECFTNLKQLEVPNDSYVLLECMSNLAANEMYLDFGAKEDTVKAVLEGIDLLLRNVKELVIVTNEIFSDSGIYFEATKYYLSCLGNINQELSRKAENVVEVVYGIPVILKGGSL